MTSNETDVAVIGGGLVGLATAHAIAAKAPHLRLTVLEAEGSVGRHQSGRNSGVLHSGVYYQPGSLKARLCRTGADRMVDFCNEHGISIEQTGKVIVATATSQIAAIEEIERRGNANGLTGLRTVDPDELAELEPHVISVAALSVPQAGVVDFSDVARRLSGLFTAMGHDVRTEFRVSAIKRSGSQYQISALTGNECGATYLVNCAGLQSDRVAALAGEVPPVTIIPFRGEYYVMRDDRDYLVRHLVYPVPDPRFPFLGVHFTRRIDGAVEVGPNAVLALGRHHYRDEAKPDWGDVRQMLRTPGLWRLGRRYWRTGATEMIRSRSKRLYASAARKLIPEVQATDLVRGGSGIRAQAVARNGKLADDFVIIENESAIHVLNAPSPAATACLAIGDRIADRLLEKSK